MRNNVAIYGGFAGVSSETALTNRPTLNSTTGQPSNSTISGNIGMVGNVSDNSLHILYNPAT